MACPSPVLLLGASKLFVDADELNAPNGPFIDFSDIPKHTCRIDIGVLMIRLIFCAISTIDTTHYPTRGLVDHDDLHWGGKEWKISADDRRQPHPTTGRGVGGGLKTYGTPPPLYTTTNRA